MKKLLFIFIVFVPSIVFCGKLSLSIKVMPQNVSVKEVSVVDNFWSLSLVEVGKEKDKKSKYVVIEGLGELKPEPLEISLVGFSFSYKEVMLTQKDKIVFVNNDKNERELFITRDGEIVNDSFVVKPSEKNSFSFLSTGNYKITDKKAPWNFFTATVIPSKRIYRIEKDFFSININDIVPGTYLVKIYDGREMIYQEDFSILGDAAYVLSYIMKNGRIERTESSVSGKGFYSVPDRK